MRAPSTSMRISGAGPAQDCPFRRFVHGIDIGADDTTIRREVRVGAALAEPIISVRKINEADVARGSQDVAVPGIGLLVSSDEHVVGHNRVWQIEIDRPLSLAHVTSDDTILPTA